MTNVNVIDFQNRVVEAMEDVILQNRPLEVETQKGAVVILSAEEYKKISHHSTNNKIPESLRHITSEQLEELEDEILLEMAEERMKNSDPSTWISFEQILAEDGLTVEDLQDFDEVEFE